MKNLCVYDQFLASVEQMGVSNESTAHCTRVLMTQGDMKQFLNTSFGARSFKKLHLLSFTRTYTNEKVEVK